MKELVVNFIGRCGGRKFLIAITGVILMACKNYFGLDDQTVAWIAGVIGVYIGGQSLADGLSGGATSTSARVNQADGKLPLLIFALCLPFLAGCSYDQAQKATKSIESCAIAYDQDRDRIDEAFITSYRDKARARADRLANDALATETGPDGKANAKNVQIILAKKVEHYAQIEQVIAGIRAKIAAAKLNQANVLAYSQALSSYFATSGTTSLSLSQSADDLLSLLSQFIGKQDAKAEVVPVP